jgi:hypothetical protein
MSEVIYELMHNIMRGGLATRFQFRGCWEWEIRDLEDYYEIKLPSLYRSFLSHMGKRAGLFGQGIDMFYRRLFHNRSAMDDVLELDGYPFTLTPTQFVFSSNQGYSFHYFETQPLVDDPPVFGYLEGDLQEKLIDTSLSSFLLSYAEEEIAGWSRVKMNTGN